MEHPPVDVALEVRRIGRWRVLCASYRGMQHVDDGSPRQDAFAIESSGSAVNVAVADGLGSADLSHLGAELACEDGVRFLAQAPPRSNGEFHEGYGRIQRNLFDKASRLRTTPRQLATTLQLLRIDQSGCGYARLGDGGCVLVENGGVKCLGGADPADIGVSNLSEPQALSQLQTDFRSSDALSAFVIFSDGLQEIFLDGDLRSANDVNVRKMVEVVQDKDMGRLIRIINLWISSDHDRDLRDDKTLIVGVLDRDFVESTAAIGKPLTAASHKVAGIEFAQDAVEARSAVPLKSRPPASAKPFVRAVTERTAIERILVACGAVASVVVLVLILIRSITGCFWFDGRCPAAPPPSAGSPPPQAPPQSQPPPNNQQPDPVGRPPDPQPPPQQPLR
jgi:hypothetical protein